jgi:hypothetical protein
MKTLVHGFAVSHWQAPDKWDWRKLKASGVELVVARACRGGKIFDNAFARYRLAADTNDIAFGASLTFAPSQSADAQISAYERQFEAVGGLRAGDVLPVLELREEAFLRQRLTNGAAARRIASFWRRRYGGLIARYSSLFPAWVGAASPNSDWAWLLADGVRHWVVDHGEPAGRPRSTLSPSWQLHQFGTRLLAEYADGAVEVAASTRSSTCELPELLFQGGVASLGWGSPGSSVIAAQPS